MRYLTFSLPADSTERLGVLHNGRIVDAIALAAGRWDGSFPRNILELVRLGQDGWRRLADLLAGKLGQQATGAPTYSPQDIRWRAPIPRPAKNVFCLGLNYMSHVKEASQARGREAKIPEVPVFFTKAPTSVNGPFDEVPWDGSLTEQVDYEAELGVVIGVGGKNIPRSRWRDHVFGYTVINDVSARDLQLKHMQWFKGKSLDGFCPMGPVVVTADEFGDPQNKAITLRVNGVVKQNSTTANMIFPIDVILEFLSRGMTLEPGDIIATGTPEGVGLGRTPQEFLNDGDIVETEIEGIGTMRNKIVKI
jgi:2-keto-4-pentenoate hydratase/2-oxohepta-3-ene-1,7-dioic acid hydratase in catechol pathway